MLPKVLKMYPGKVSAAFWHNPLPFHNLADPAARAVTAAQLQGRFWEYHDLLFENQKSLSPERLLQLAEQAGLDVERLKWDMEDTRVAAFVDANAQAAAAVGIKGTPMFLINGKVIRGAQPPEKFKEILDVEIEKAEKALAEGVPREELAERMARDNGADDTYVKLFVKRDFSGLGAAPEKKKPTTGEGPEAPPVEETVWKVMVSAGDPSIGPANAPLTVVAFSEFQCPYCAKGTSLLERILEEYKGKVRIVFKNFPLPFHKDAMLASEAAMAAHAQGKFWEMHDLLFENQRALAQADLERYAKEIGLDLNRFNADLAGHIFQPVVERQLQEGRDVGVKGTPNYFINGRVVKGAVPFDALKSVLDEELKKGQLLASRGDDDPYNTLIKDGKVFVPFDETAATFDLEGLPSLGPTDATYTFVVFSDFQCPFCSRYAEPAKALQKEFGDKGRLVFMQFPLPSHSNAHVAAEAALAAHAQGKFWEMHDKLFEHRQDLDRSNLDRYAEEIGLDTERFRREMNDETYKAAIEAQMEAGRKAGVNGTPTLFVNGHKYMGGSKDPRELAAAIDKFFASR